MASQHWLDDRRDSALTSRIERALTPFREFGAAAGALYILSRLLCRLSPDAQLFVYEFMVQPIIGRPLVPPRTLATFETRRIMPGDPALAEMPVPETVVQARFEQGAACYGTFKRGRFVGYIWFSFESYDEDEVICRYVLIPERRSVFDFDLYIFPEYRLGRAFAVIWQNAMTVLQGLGVDYSFSRVSRFNLATRRAHAHFGWKRLGRAVFVRLWRLEWMLATLPPYVSCSRGSHRPELKLRADVLKDPASDENL